MAEGDERGLIRRLQRAQHGAAGRLQPIETVARDAVAHVEREDRIERNLLEADEIDLLRHAVVDHLEIRSREAAHRLSLIGDEHIDADRLDPRRKARLLRAGAQRRGRREDKRRCESRRHGRSLVRNG